MISCWLLNSWLVMSLARASRVYKVKMRPGEEKVQKESQYTWLDLVLEPVEVKVAKL